ncbi:kinase-like domain-containing protein [Diplogelasinospora grovesii]|uniref:non-specific serine/threonine protein kinase n=1 Tax=Diplogelasinospora grovesii TaxID=303347 RepID=A0AAN6RZR6_9PEZI|nr:kinase-like domain-containing protein [Diplogelasinospora grovesii]
MDPSQYKVGIPGELWDNYRPGGFHPVHIKDLLKDGRYKIINKLGAGSSSTVWLARDNHNQCNVSVKIVLARESDEACGGNHQLQIMRHITENGDPNHPGRKHVSHLLDSFYHEGPNGRHLCIVQELIGPDLEFVTMELRFELNRDHRRRVSAQLLLAVDYLHSCGVVHGDIHKGNVLFRLADIDRSTLRGIQRQVSSPNKAPIVRKDGLPLEKGMLQYTVVNLLYDGDMYDPQYLNQVQLVDFGKSFFISTPPKLHRTPPWSYRSPEQVFRHTLTEAIDIWSLGCITYQLITTDFLFGWMFQEPKKPEVLIRRFQRILGDVPEEWIREALESGVLKKEPHDKDIDLFQPLEAQLLDSGFGFEADDPERPIPPLHKRNFDLLLNYIQKTLVVNAEQRATSEDLLADPWVTGANQGRVA